MTPAQRILAVAAAALGLAAAVDLASAEPRTSAAVRPLPALADERDESPQRDESRAVAEHVDLDARLAALRAKEAELRAQLDVARLAGETREHFLARCASGLGEGCPRAHAPRDVLEARARCGTVVWDGMPSFSAERREAHGISAREHEILERLVAATERETQQAIADNWRRATGEEPPAADGPFPSSTMRIELGLRERFPEPKQDEVIGRIARELAGELPRPTRFEEASPYYWHMSLRVSQGDRLEQAIASELGRERARELRMLGNGWGGGTSYSAGLCDEPQAP
jgi:hypothetical protein